MAQKIVFRNGKIISPKQDELMENQFSGSFVISGDNITHVGCEADEAVRTAKEEGAEVIDLQGRVVLPGFIDGHAFSALRPSSTKTGFE
jgi:predicted amidohydrolase YtcJ